MENTRKKKPVKTTNIIEGKRDLKKNNFSMCNDY